MPSGRAETHSHATTLMDHIRELRTRLFIVAVAFIVGSSLAYVYRDPLVKLLLSPLHGQKLVYLNVAGGFNFIFLISIYAGLAVAAPLAIQQIYQFLQPVLPKKIQHYSARIFFSSLILLAGGAVFGYIFAIPGALQFLYTFAGSYVQASLTADSYLSFIIAYTIGLGLVFQVPLVLLFIHWIKPLKPRGLLKSERWVILLSFIIAAILTPTPDPINQTIIAVPIIFVYQIGVVAVLISIHNAHKRDRKAARLLKRQQQPVFQSKPPVVRPQLVQPAVAMPPSTPAEIAQHATTVKKRTSLDGMIGGSHQPMTIKKPLPPPQTQKQVVAQPLQPRTALHIPTRPAAPTTLMPPKRPQTPLRRFAIDGVSPLLS